MKGSNSQLSLTQLRQQKDFFIMKDIAAVFPFDILKVYNFFHFALHVLEYNI